MFHGWNGKMHADFSWDDTAISGNKFRTNDGIEVILDVENESLSFAVNGVIARKPYVLPKGKYCLCIELFPKHDSLAVEFERICWHKPKKNTHYS